MIKGSDVRLADKWGTTGEHVAIVRADRLGAMFLWYPGGLFAV